MKQTIKELRKNKTEENIMFPWCQQRPQNYSMTPSNLQQNYWWMWGSCCLHILENGARDINQYFLYLLWWLAHSFPCLFLNHSWFFCCPQIKSAQECSQSHMSLSSQSLIFAGCGGVQCCGLTLFSRSYYPILLRLNSSFCPKGSVLT